MFQNKNIFCNSLLLYKLLFKTTSNRTKRFIYFTVVRFASVMKIIENHSSLYLSTTNAAIDYRYVERSRAESLTTHTIRRGRGRGGASSTSETTAPRGFHRLSRPPRAFLRPRLRTRTGPAGASLPFDPARCQMRGNGISASRKPPIENRCNEYWPIIIRRYSREIISLSSKD